MKYPLELKSTILDSEIAIADADEQIIFRMSGFMVLQGSQRLPVYKIKSDFSFAPNPVFRLDNMSNEPAYSVRRNNLFSFFESWYQVLLGNEVKLKIREGKALGKVFGGIFDGTPFERIGARVWNPAFLILRTDNSIIMTLNKKRSFTGKHYILNRHVDFIDTDEERMALLSLFGLMSLEKRYRNRLF